MKILSNSSGRRLGGIERMVENLDSQAEKYGHELVLVSRSVDTTRDYINFDKSPRTWFFGSGFQNAFTASIRGSRNSRDMSEMIGVYKPKFKRVIEEEKPDIALLNGTSGIPYILSRACVDLGVPYVVAIRGILSKEEPLAGNKIENEMVRDSAQVVYISNVCKEHFEKNNGKVSESSVIYNSISRNFLRNSEREGTGIGWVGRNSAIKRLGFFLEIMAKLSSSEEIEIITNNGMYPKNMSPNISYLPIIDGIKELSDFYASKRVMVSTSEFETWGNVPFESLLSGTPIVVSKDMGVSEVLGILDLEKLIVQEGSIEEYIHRINLASKTLISREQRHLLANHFSIENMALKYFTLLENVRDKQLNRAHNFLNRLKNQPFPTSYSTSHPAVQVWASPQL